MKHRLISIASITILLFMVLGNCIGCSPTTPTTTYTLTTNSTAGGGVTTPGESTYTYNASQVVNLVATADSGYRFVNWTGNVSTIANVTAASTTITMNGNYTITANFALGVLIANVPDANQPPTSGSPNYCAPMAMINVLEYWDIVKGLPNATNVTAGLLDKTAADYLGWFMDTNNAGSSLRANAGQPGTLDVDIAPGTVDFVRWDATHLFAAPPPPAPALPAGKLGYDWTVTFDHAGGFNFYKTEIDAGRPLVVSFAYWNPVSVGINVTDPETGATIDVFDWGVPKTGSTSPNPDEAWVYYDIGHAVTGVGYILNWDPDGSGPLPSDNYVIVHDNWATTPTNIAIPWGHWNSSDAVLPGP